MEGARVGDECVVLGDQKGPQGTAVITAEEIAEQLGTIPWEVLTAVSAPRATLLSRALSGISSPGSLSAPLGKAREYGTGGHPR